MKEKLISALVSLLKVKSLITLLSFGAFFYLSVTEKINVDNFMLIRLEWAYVFIYRNDEGKNIWEFIYRYLRRN